MLTFYRLSGFLLTVLVLVALNTAATTRMSVSKTSLLVRPSIFRLFSAHRWRRHIASDASAGGGNASQLALPTDRKVTIKSAAELYERMQKLVGSGRFYKSFADGKGGIDRQKLMQMLPASQDELPVRHLADSYDEAIISVGSSAALRSRYQTAFDTTRIGRLLEDLDGFAVWLAYKHNYNPRVAAGEVTPLVIVTALVDRLDIHQNIVLHADRDIILKGQVTWAGHSSCEAFLKVYQKMQNDNTQQLTHVLDARFVLVARDPLNRGKAFLNPLEPANEHERALFETGQRNHERRRRAQEQSVYRIPPNEDERRLIHTMFLDMYYSTGPGHGKEAEPWTVATTAERRKPTASVWMRETVLNTCHLCHPEFRNSYDKIFGGFLMREAFELAFCSAHMLSRERPQPVAIDDIMFRHPVDVGSILLTTCTIIYTHDRFMQAQVVAEVHHPERNERQITNVFYFTFASEKPVPPVIPETYAEHMAYITGKRHFDEAMRCQEDLLLHASRS